ncbi:hypothetical protein [Halomicronema hongdechloris]|nr:hypothetical protein [Halomicronema hongdechloris]
MATGDRERIQQAIRVLRAQLPIAPVRSVESAAVAMAQLMRLERELYPHNADEVAELAVRYGVDPGEFIQVLQEKWHEKKGF